MQTYRNHARLIGILYIIGTLSGILSVVFSDALLSADDFLAEIAANENQLIMGALAILSMGISLALIPAVAWPVLKKHNESLAMGYVIFRGGLETATYLFSVVSWFLLIIISREYVDTDQTSISQLRTMGIMVKDMGDWISHLTTIIFITGALMFYTVLYQTRLIPRWISGWGLLSAIPFVGSVFLAMFGVIEVFSTPQVLSNMPLAFQEMFMAVWLIVRGFDQSATVFSKN